MKNSIYFGNTILQLRLQFAEDSESFVQFLATESPQAFVLSAVCYLIWPTFTYKELRNKKR